MGRWESLLLGLLQGVTEFLPISSSGHLVLLQHWLGVDQPGVVLDVYLHFVTLLAVIVFFWYRLRRLTRDDLVKLALGSLPVALVGWFFKDQIIVLFQMPVFVGGALLVTALLNFLIDRRLEVMREVEQKMEVGTHQGASLTIRRVLIIGIIQAFSLLPGLSRSGATLAGGILQGVRRRQAFEFSFLLSIPAVLGASFLELWEAQLVWGTAWQDAIFEPSIFVVSGLAAFVSGLLSLKALSYMMKQARFEVFAIYCLVVGLAALFWG